MIKIAVIGATGLVGACVVQELQASAFSDGGQLFLCASEASAGRTTSVSGHTYPLLSVEEVCAAEPELAIFAADAAVALQWAPLFVQKGTTVIDNSSAYRMQAPLIVPEINASVLKKSDKIIANPNCSTIQMVLALYPLHQAFGLKRVVVSTYQSVIGAGAALVQQMQEERAGSSDIWAIPDKKKAIDLNLIPHIDAFEADGYTREEHKLMREALKIMNASFGITATAVRVPVMGGHSESINATFEKDVSLAAAAAALKKMPGVVVQAPDAFEAYPMPRYVSGKKEVFVGRLRKDTTCAHTLNMWVVSDNLRKGAATNAVQIAHYLLENNLINTK